MAKKRNLLKELEDREVKLEYLGLLDEKIDLSGVPNPFVTTDQFDKDNPHIHLLKIIRKPENFWFTVKYIFNIELAPFQLVILNELWHRKYPMLIASRGGSKSFLLALYSMLKALICQGSKIVIVGAAFRQAKVVFEYCEAIWHNAPVLRDLVSTNNRSGPRRDIDRCTCTIGDSIIVALPLGDGSKIRGQRANVIIADEFASIPRSIYEEVVSGFAAVSASPVEAMKRAARKRYLQKKGKWTEEREKRELRQNLGNQAIIAGTANYGFNHFADYWKEYKGIIESRGDKQKLMEVFNGKIPSKFNWRNYSIIRIPVELIPEAFMDEEHVARAKATTDSGSYSIEYGAVFATDSNGFYKRSLIEGCVVSSHNLDSMLAGVHIFNARMKGDPHLKYIFGVDPASEGDNFSITILELRGNHRRIVYCWTTAREKHIERIKSGTVKEKNFFAYCARKIRDLMKVFNCERIVMDSQGGGRQISEALHDTDKMKENEVPIWEIKVDGEEKWSDNQAGLHIIELVNFANAQWVSEANMGMKKDMEDRVLLFPYFDPIKIFDAVHDDKVHGRVIINKEGKEIHLEDTLEDNMLEIEEIKNELVTIVHTQVGQTMRDHWDVPEIKGPGGKKGRLRKDRYSALLMANMTARQMQRAPAEIVYKGTGGFAQQLVETTSKQHSNQLYEGPEWFTSKVNQKTPQHPNYGMIVHRPGVFPNR